MNNKRIYQIGGIALGVFAAIYLYRKFIKKKTTEIVDSTTVAGGSGVGILTKPLSDLSSYLTTYNDYVVNTESGSLNVRRRADAKSQKVTSLPKGSTIKAKASGLKGWMEVSKDGQSTLGYVSQEFLKPKMK